MQSRGRGVDVVVLRRTQAALAGGIGIGGIGRATNNGNGNNKRQRPRGWSHLSYDLPSALPIAQVARGIPTKAHPTPMPHIRMPASGTQKKKWTVADNTAIKEYMRM